MIYLIIVEPKEHLGNIVVILVVVDDICVKMHKVVKLSCCVFLTEKRENAVMMFENVSPKSIARVTVVARANGNTWKGDFVRSLGDVAEGVEVILFIKNPEKEVL